MTDITNEDCEHKTFRTADSRKRVGYTFRRKECKECKHRWTTVEVPLITRRSDGISDPDALIGAVSRQLGKGLADQQIDALINLLASFKTFDEATGEND